MARNKYIQDYRLVETVDERGRIHTDYEYIGKHFCYIHGLEKVRREKKCVLAALIAGWLAFVGALLPRAMGMSAVYVILPFVFTALPLGILSDTVLTAMAGEEPLRHQQADRLENRYPPAALWTACLPAASLAGQAVRLLRGGAVNGGDLAFCLCAAALTAAGIFAFSRRKSFLCRAEDA